MIFGLSGGIDSAVVAVLCKRAVGSERSLAEIMPEKDSKMIHIENAVNFASELGMETRLIDSIPYLKNLGTYQLFPLNRFPFLKRLKGSLISKAYNLYERKTGETPFSASIPGFRDKWFEPNLKKGNVYYRTKHRVRMMLLYLYGELENRLVVGCANKTEYKIEFFIKHGCDDAADIMPLLNLYKLR